MKTFKNELPGDFVTLEMRIKEDVRHMMQALFISSEDKKKMLEDALELSISRADILKHIEEEASKAIRDATKEYFSFGEGGILLRKAMNEALHEILPKIFSKDVKNG